MRLPLALPGDAELLEGLLEKRPAAVAALYDKFGSHVHWVLVRMLGSDRDVEDLVQDTFITVVERCSLVYEPSALRSFVVSVAIRHARNEMRKRAVRRWIGLDEATNLPASSGQDPEVEEALRHVYVALEKLGPDKSKLANRHGVNGLQQGNDVKRCPRHRSLASMGCWLKRARMSIWYWRMPRVFRGGLRLLAAFCARFAHVLQTAPRQHLQPSCSAAWLRAALLVKH